MKRVSETIENLLNLQIQREEESSRLYRAMSQCLEFKGWLGSAKLYSKYADEEIIHMKKFYEYLQDRDAHPVTPILKQPQQEFKDIEEILTLSYEHEMQVTKWLSTIATTALSEKDMVTFEFMQWFLLEQREEELKFMDLINIKDVMKSTGTPLYFLDKELESRV